MGETYGTGILPVLIFLARICDVSLGTLRTIAVVRGRVVLASLLGFCEVSIWIVILTQVMQSLGNPWNMVGWALGFAAGNAVGILIERRLARGHLVVRVLSRQNAAMVAGALRALGQRVTEFLGWEPDGEVKLLYTVVHRSRLQKAVEAARNHDPDCVFVAEDVRQYHQHLRPTAVPATGWRAIAKKK